MNLNLAHIDPSMHAIALHHFQEGSERFISVMGMSMEAAILVDNIVPLQSIGRYEEALVSAYVSTRTNFHEWKPHDVDKMFRQANKEKLRSLGSPIPNEMVTVYRGVAGRGRQRRVRGWSWTSSKEIACWFATRIELADPAVYTAEITPEEILYITNDRGEQEYIVKPSKSKRLAINHDEIVRLATLHQQMMALQQMKKIEAMKMNLSLRGK